MAVRAGDVLTVWSAKNLTETCKIGSGRWGFTSDSYSAAVGAIQSKESLSVEGFVGFSFGSARWSYLKSFPLRWTVLSRPFPIGATGDQIVQARSAAVMNQRPDARHLMSPAQQSGRSIPVTNFDLLSAQIQLAYLPAAERQDLSAQLSDGGALKAARQLSDRLWSRYGESDIAPSYLAYLDELCSATTWPTAARADTVSGVLAALTLPCRTVVPQSSAVSAAVGKVCIVTDDADLVTPGSLTRRSMTPLVPGASWVRSKDAQHASVDGVTTCLKRVT